MKRKITAVIIALIASLSLAAGAQAHSTAYNLQHNIAGFEQVQLRAVYMFGVSGGDWTAEMCSNHYIGGGSIHYVANVTEWVLQGKYSNGGNTWNITVAYHYPYLCDPSTFGQIIPFRVRR